MKFKNIKKKIYKKKSPSNSRTITEPKGFTFSFPKINPIKLYGRALKVFVVSIFMFTAIIVGYDLQKNLQTKQNIDSQREILIRDLKFWNDFISKNQNYPDAYFQAAVLEYRLGEISKARKYVEKGLFLEPNSIDGRRIEQFLK